MVEYSYTGVLGTAILLMYSVRVLYQETLLYSEKTNKYHDILTTLPLFSFSCTINIT